MENTARGEHVKRQIQHSTLPRAVFVSRHLLSAVFSIHTSVSGALIDICDHLCENRPCSHLVVIREKN